jgi:hypothetical protein
MLAFIRNLFAASTTTPAAARKTRLSMEGLGERLAPALLVPTAGTEATAVQTRGIIVVGGHTTTQPTNAIPGTYIPGVYVPGSGDIIGTTRGIVVVGG